MGPPKLSFEIVLTHRFPGLDVCGDTDNALAGCRQPALNGTIRCCRTNVRKSVRLLRSPRIQALYWACVNAITAASTVATEYRQGLDDAPTILRDLAVGDSKVRTNWEPDIELYGLLWRNLHQSRVVRMILKLQPQVIVASWAVSLPVAEDHRKDSDVKVD